MKSEEEFEQYLIENWGRQPFEQIQQIIPLGIYELLTLALKLNLQNVRTQSPKNNRAWDEQELRFLVENADFLTTQEAANILHRTRYATYLKIRYLGLNQMINKK